MIHTPTRWRVLSALSLALALSGSGLARGNADATSLLDRAGLHPKDDISQAFELLRLQQPDLPAEVQLYLAYKQSGEPMPAWLWDRINPPSDPPAQRQGGEDAATAVPITELPFNDTGTTTGYIGDIGPYSNTGLTCAWVGFFSATSTGNSLDVWYSLVLAQETTLTISLCGSGYDTGLGVFADDGGTVGAMVAGNDDACSLQSQITACTLPAGSYFVVVDGYGTSNGAYTLAINEVENPCDAYAEAVTAFTAPLSVTGSNVGEPSVYGGLGGDIGFDVTIPADGFWDFDTCMPGTTSALDVYLFTASPCEGGTLIASNLGGTCLSFAGAGRLLEQNLTAGTYHVLIGNSGTIEGAFELIVQETPGRPTQGGPDAMGYVWISSQDEDGPEYNWVDIFDTGTQVTLADDSFTGPIDLGIQFPFYDQMQTQVYIGSNGFLSFGAGYTSLSNQSLPTAATPNNLIAMFWDDLYPTAASTGTVKYLSDPENDRFIVQFTTVPHCCNPTGPPETFQCILYGDGNILVQFQDMQGSRISATVGIENSTGTIGLMANYNDVGALIGNEVAIAFIPQEGDFVPPLIVHTPLQSVETELAGGYDVSATITDDSGVGSANIIYTVNGGAPQTVAMSNVTADVWSGQIPHLDMGSAVAYRIEARDAGENQALAVSATWNFSVVSYTWPPVNLSASDGNLLSTSITWLPPVNPGLLTARFDGRMPRHQDEFIAWLMEGEGLSKEEAYAEWDALFSTGERAFIEYNVYRNGALMGTTTGLSYADNLTGGADPDVTYTYTVTAQFTAGESQASNADDGYWSLGQVEGGPDGFGYTWKNSSHAEGPVYSWTDISTSGTLITGATDDGFTGPYALGFSFPFYENAYTDVYVASNGFLTFGAGNGSLGNHNFPNPLTPNNVVAPFWDDLNPTYAGSTIHYLADEANNRFIVQWHVPAFGSVAPYVYYDFQAILEPNGRVLAQWANVNETDISQATVGIENSAGVFGLAYNFDGTGAPIADGVAVAFRYPVGPLIAHTPLTDVETELPGDHVVTATITSELGVASALVSYTVDGGAAQTVAMSEGAGNTWTGGIPHQPAGVTVAYHIEATDDQGNERATQTWSFTLVSSQWPPRNLSATDGLLSQTNLTWQAPINPGVLAQWFGDAAPATEDEALPLLMARHGLSKLEALAVWQELVNPSDRVFIEYNVYRDGELLGQTTGLTFTDNADLGSESDVTYTYTVTAEFTAGESQPSNADTGYWGSPPTFGGPDAAGYMWVNSLNPAGPEFEWEDISTTGVLLPVTGDDSQTSIELPFPFPFYGGTYTTTSVVSNGYVNFGPVSTIYTNTAIPNTAVPNGCIFALWDDLFVPAGAGIYYLSDPDNGRAIVQWNNVTPLGSQTTPHTFQVVMNASGIIEVRFQSVSEAQVTDCTVGIEDLAGAIGLQVNRDNEGGAIADELVVLFTPASNCEPVECVGTAETEPNEGWNDNNASYDVIHCGETMCGTVLADGTSTDTDWYLYTHFGGNITVNLQVSDFDGRVSLREFAVDGAVVANANTFPRCFSEAFTVNGLQGGTYFVVVEHTGDPDVTTPQTYSLSLVCSGDPCAGHLPVECDGTAEVEPNEGWNATPPNSSYGEIVSGETVCGAVWADAGVRDMDWFHFSLSSHAIVHVEAQVDAFDAALFLTDFDAAGSVLMEVDENPACSPETLHMAYLPAGEYFIAIGNNSFDGVPTPQNYSLTLTIGGAEAVCDNYHDLGDLGGTVVTLDHQAPLNTHHSGTGCPGGITSLGKDEVVRLVLTQTTDLEVTLQGAGNADEAILLLGNCAQPESSCGAAANAQGSGTSMEILVMNNVPAGDYFIVADFIGVDESHPYVMTIRDMEVGMDEGRDLSFALQPAFPNPFNPSTTFSWTQPALAQATLTVHDLRGAVVETLDLGVRGAGHHQFVWDAARFGSGVYFCTLSAGDHVATVKAVLLK